MLYNIFLDQLSSDCLDDFDVCFMKKEFKLRSNSQKPFLTSIRKRQTKFRYLLFCKRYFNLREPEVN